MIQSTQDYLVTSAQKYWYFLYVYLCTRAATPFLLIELPLWSVRVVLCSNAFGRICKRLRGLCTARSTEADARSFVDKTHGFFYYKTDSWTCSIRSITPQLSCRPFQVAALLATCDKCWTTLTTCSRLLYQERLWCGLASRTEHRGVRHPAPSWSSWLIFIRLFLSTGICMCSKFRFDMTLTVARHTFPRIYDCYLQKTGMI